MHCLMLLFMAKSLIQAVLRMKGQMSQLKGASPGSLVRQVMSMKKAHGRRLWPLSPFSKFARGWQMLITLVDATYSAFLIPIAIAFNWNDRYFSWYNGIDIAAGGILPTSHATTAAM